MGVLSEIACHMAKQNAVANNINAVVVQGDILRPPFLPGMFETVISQGLIEHFANPLKILKKCSEMGSPGEYLITTFPYIAGSCGFLMKIMEPENFDKHMCISLIDLLSIYEKLRLEVVVSGPMGSFYTPYFHR